LTIHTSTPVISITQNQQQQQDQDQNTAHDNNNKNLVTITTTDSKTGMEKIYIGETCIVTVSLNVLKYNGIQFVPNLSYDKQTAIQSMKMEPGTKLIYIFKNNHTEQRQLWDPNLTYMLTHHQNILESSKSTKMRTTRWWTPGYGHSTSSSTTPKSNNRTHNNNIIMSYTTADFAVYLDQLLEKDAIQCGLNDLSILLSVSIELLRSNLVYSKRISWSHDPYTLGAYAHVPPGCSSSSSDNTNTRQALAKAEGSIYFAGEATAYDTTPQTVHGAIYTGIRAANEILSTKLKKKRES
jgi:monoamine oxidase